MNKQKKKSTHLKLLKSDSRTKRMDKLEYDYHHARYNYLPQRKAQVHLITSVLGVFIFLATYFYFKINTLFAKILEGNYKFQGESVATSDLKEIVGHELFLLKHDLMLSSVLVISFLTVLLLYMSSKLTGPLRKISNHFNKINGVKDLKKIRFRKNDYYKNVEASINGAFDRMKDQGKKKLTSTSTLKKIRK